MTEIEQWRSPETKVITVTQDVFGGSTFDIVCREFIPIEGDSLQRTWKKNGVTQYYPRAPYAIANMKETGNEIGRFVANNIGLSIKRFIEVKNDKLLSSTYAMAHAMVFRPLSFTRVSQPRLSDTFRSKLEVEHGSTRAPTRSLSALGRHPHGVPIRTYLRRRDPWHGTSVLRPGCEYLWNQLDSSHHECPD